MTYHSLLDWQFDREVTSAVVTEVIEGLRYNKQYNKGSRYTPDAYITFNDVDSLIYQIGMFLDVHEAEESIPEKTVSKFLQGAPESGKAITKQVIAELHKC